jgi:hypothetical protein
VENGALPVGIEPTLYGRRFLQEIEAGTKNPTVNVITQIKLALKASWEDLLG